MILKPKSTTLNEKALVYKRFISLASAENTNMCYATRVDDLYWTFNKDTLSFEQLAGGDSADISGYSVTNILENSTDVFQYMSHYYRYVGEEQEVVISRTWNTTTREVEETTQLVMVYSWQEITDLSGLTLLSEFNNIAKYQTNRYYFVGSMDFMYKGNIESNTTQFLKGNILALSSVNIKYFCDDIKLSKDDLIVIDNRLYSIESTEMSIKRLPKPFYVYYATLNSIL